jgi:hypothetical protein
MTANVLESVGSKIRRNCRANDVYCANPIIRRCEAGTQDREHDRRKRERTIRGILPTIRWRYYEQTVAGTQPVTGNEFLLTPIAQSVSGGGITGSLNSRIWIVIGCEKLSGLRVHRDSAHIVA